MVTDWLKRFSIHEFEVVTSIFCSNWKETKSILLPETLGDGLDTSHTLQSKHNWNHYNSFTYSSFKWCKLDIVNVFFYFFWAEIHRHFSVVFFSPVCVEIHRVKILWDRKCFQVFKLELNVSFQLVLTYKLRSLKCILRGTSALPVSEYQLTSSLWQLRMDQQWQLFTCFYFFFSSGMTPNADEMH